MKKLTIRSMRARFFVPVLLLSLISVNVSAAFNHPGIYMSEPELYRMKEVVNSSEDSRMKRGYAYMQNQKGPWSDVPKQPYGSLDYTPNPMPGPQNYNIRHAFANDGMAAETHALMWVVTGDKQHSDKAIEIMNAWAKKESPADSLVWLGVGFFASDWFSCADILRYYKGGYSGWLLEDINAFGNFTKAIKKLALSHDGTGITNPYQCQNQNVLMARVRMAIGVYDDDEDLFNNGLNLLQKNLYGGSAIENLWNKKVTVFERTIAPNGEIMELNRSKTGDFDHANIGLCGLVEAAEISWHQGRENLYEKRFEVWDETEGKLVLETTPRLIKGLEYWSKGVMNSSFQTTKSGVVTPSSITRYRKCYDYVVNHYKYRLSDKYNMPETEAYMDYIIEKKRYSGSWTATHADLSKDLSVAVGSKDIKTKKSNIMVTICKNKIVSFDYGDAKNATVKIFTPAGKMVKKVSLNGAKKVSLKSINHGLYLVKFTADGISETKKFLLK